MNESETEAFKQLLRSHDWFYYRSDDPQVYRAGQRASDEIQLLVEKNAGFRKLQHEAMDHLYNNTPAPGWWKP